MAIVYQHRRKDTNEVFYVGIGVNLKRPYDKNKRSTIWKNIVNKHGYEVEILYENLTFNECKEIEKELIAKYGRIDLKNGTLCNLTDGGDGTLGFIFSEERLKKMSILQTGKNNPMFGKKHSEETRKKISKTIKGENHPMFGRTVEDHPMFGKKRSEETRKKISETIKGENHPMFGRKHSEETIRKISEAKRKNKESLDN